MKSFLVFLILIIIYFLSLKLSRFSLKISKYHQVSDLQRIIFLPSSYKKLPNESVYLCRYLVFLCL